MPKTILWLDNDEFWTRPYVRALADNGFNIVVVDNLTTAEQFLRNNKPQLIIIDVMITTLDAQEEARFPNAVTEDGRSTGLAFYAAIRPFLEEHAIKAIALTVRLDGDIEKRFIAAGLPSEYFASKYSLRELPSFVEKITAVVGAN